MLGQTILNYKILEKLGEGSMGIVYKAQDVALGQTVALRFLPAILSTAEIDRARSILEVRAAATLSHPNICAVHAIKDHEGSMVVVSDFVDGETVRAKLKAGPLQVRRAIEIGMQIAEGLAVLHEHGMIHRNVRPENVMIRKDGAVQVMDIGLLWRGSLSAHVKSAIPTGNPACMSPELIEGQATDPRTDMFSLGVVLYEMLAGQAPFRGSDDAAVIQEILYNDPPPPGAAAEGIDEALGAIVMECLVKDPAERYQSARELAKDLRRYVRTMSRSEADRLVKVNVVKTAGADPAAAGHGTVVTALVRVTKRALQRGEPPAAESAANQQPLVPSPPLWKYAPWILAALFLCAAAWFGVVGSRGFSSEARVVSTFVRPPENSQFAGMSGGAGGGHFALSPDGTQLTFAATDSTGATRLWVRTLSSLRCVPLPGTEDGSYPFWSPDSRFIGFFAGGKLRKIPASGGPVAVLCDAPAGRGGSWGSGDVIVFAPSPGEALSRIAAGGGTPSPATKLDASRLEQSHRWPWFLPDGKHFLYLARASATDIIYAASLDGKEEKELLRKHSNVLYASGCLLFMEQGGLIAQPFDPAQLELKGLPSTVAEDVRFDPGYDRGEFAASAHGELLYREGGTESAGLAWFDRSGTFAGFVARAVRNFDARLSADGQKVAYSNDEEEGASRRMTTDLWVFDRSHGVPSHVTADPGDETNPVWSPDGKQIVFASNRSGRANPYRINADGTGGEDPLMSSDYNLFPTDWSADGKYIALERGPAKEEKWSIWILPLAAGRKPYAWFKSSSDVQLGKFSPDGRWMAYVSDEAGQQQVFVRPFPGPGSRVQVSPHGCNGEAFWRRDGKEIYYMSMDFRVMAAEIARAGSSLKVGRLREVLNARSRGIRFLRGIAPDNQRLLGVYNPADARPADLTLVTGWPSELRAP
ncbi:MAG TPA: protein kinase [Bacteroidota bacterium]|nr:protein kinase [Bacteroidota bacterium]